MLKYGMKIGKCMGRKGKRGGEGGVGGGIKCRWLRPKPTLRR